MQQNYDRRRFARREIMQLHIVDLRLARGDLLGRVNVAGAKKNNNY